MNYTNTNITSKDSNGMIITNQEVGDYNHSLRIPEYFLTTEDTPFDPKNEVLMFLQNVKNDQNLNLIACITNNGISIRYIDVCTYNMYVRKVDGEFGLVAENAVKPLHEHPLINLNNSKTGDVFYTKDGDKLTYVYKLIDSEFNQKYLLVNERYHCLYDCFGNRQDFFTLSDDKHLYVDTNRQK